MRFVCVSRVSSAIYEQFVTTFYSNRHGAQEYVTAIAKEYMEDENSWGIFKIINTDRRDNYVVVNIKYQTKADFVPPERWLYIFPNTAEIMQTSLMKRLSKGDYYKYETGFTLAEKITGDLQKISKDKQLNFTFSQSALPLQQCDPINDENLLFRQKLNNYGFERAERLPGNIGFLVINEFVYPEHAGRTAADAMSFISGTDGLIIDLRTNYGGSSLMSAFISSYLLDGSSPVHLNDIYWRFYDTTQSIWSLPFVSGQRFGANKPVYILTSQNTGSCAEEFAYSLQAARRQVAKQMLGVFIA